MSLVSSQRAVVMVPGTLHIQGKMRSQWNLYSNTSPPKSILNMGLNIRGATRKPRRIC